MKEKKLIENCDAMPIVKAVNNDVKKVHQRISNINFHNYPCVIYCLAYQDGVMHAFDRFIQLYSKGDYNIPGQISASVRAYSQIVQKCLDAENYWDAAYYEGYLNALILIASCEENQDIIKEFPFLYLPNAKRMISSYNVFFEELKRVTKKSDRYHKYAISIVEKFKDPEIVVHHPPY